MPESPTKRVCLTDPALDPRSESQVKAVVNALGPELDPRQELGPTTYEIADGPKLAVKDANGRAKTLNFPPGPLTAFITEQGAQQWVFQAGVNDTEHPHYELLRAAFLEFGGGNGDDIPLGNLWEVASTYKSLFPKSAPNLKELNKMSQEKRLAAMNKDFASTYPGEGLRGKMTLMPSTIAIKQSKNGPMFTLTATYRPISRDTDRAASAGVPLTPRMEAHLAANPTSGVEMKTTPFITTSGKKLDTGDLLRLPYVVTQNCEFLKIWAAATVALPAVVPTSAYDRLTMPCYLNWVRIYGVVGSNSGLDEPPVDEHKIASVYASLCA